TPGGDAFFLVDDGTDVVAIDGSGAAPAAATLERYREIGEIPEEGPLASAVPGVISAWGAAHARWGKRPIRELLAPAIDAAREGVPVTPRLRKLLEGDAPVFRCYPSSERVFLPYGKIPEVGESFAQPLLANTLERLAHKGLGEIYTGELAREIVAALRESGGLFDEDDFAAQEADVLTPVRAGYRDVEVVEQPPVSQGVVALLALRILERFDVKAAANASARRVHLLVESIRLAFEERMRALGDPRFVDFSADDFLSDATVERLFAELDPRRAGARRVLEPVHPDTTAAVYADGTMTVAYIHSLYSSSGFVAGETGILMNNRLRGASLDPASPNVLAPRKRPIHTLNQYLIRKNGRTVLAGGTPGAIWQIYTNVQMMTTLIDDRLELTDAIAAPRFVVGSQKHHEDATIHLESRAGEQTAESLRAMGHAVDVIGPWDAGAAVQLAARDERGTLRAATEIRRPGCTALAF
ncbi:MAG: gamma-glutamyltransferase, partial [Candidatus Eremiobacteraeota bacterium]|nr:gamma-glutamyltransferase [Candidatus Eremiobacteraeota bacterium]